MIRSVFAYCLVLLLGASSLILADARGHTIERGTEIAICSGTHLTTITVGADGQPIKTVEVCPDGASIFAATFDLPVLDLPTPRLLTASLPVAPITFGTRNELSPSARGPPALV